MGKKYFTTIVIVAISFHISLAQSDWGQKRYLNCVDYAKGGNPTAQKQLGDCYRFGYGVAKDDKQAFYWYQKAAEQGNDEAQEALGDCYSSGRGVFQDKTLAFQWYQKSADQGNKYGQHSLANCYMHGNGVKVDYAKAAYWYEQAIANGFTGLNKNLKKARKLLKAQGSVGSASNGKTKEETAHLTPNQGIVQNVLEDINPSVLNSDVDTNLPVFNKSNENTFAVIIGNEKYTHVERVMYANNDAKIFAEYCKKTLGLPDKNVKVYENASFGTMIGAVSDLQKIAKAFKGNINVVFYYAGHGIPDEATGDSYLLPIDADGMKTEVCYPLNRLYKELGGLGANSVVVFLDACFSGSQRGGGMVVAARGVAIKAKSDRPVGNTVVFAAATDKQTAYPFKEKGHGMFTYYLLNKLRDSKGDCTLGELGSYICNEVPKQAVITNGKEQTPVVLTSQALTNSWRNMKLK